MKELKIAILISSVAVLGFAISTNTAAATSVQVEQEPKQEENHIELAMIDLPAATQEDIRLNHSDAKFVSAYKLTDEDGVVKYKVLLNDRGKELKLWYDAEGKSIK